MQIAVIGLSHRTAPVEIREKVSIPEQQVAEYVSRLRSCSQIAECAILSTCNRLEIYAVLRDSEHGLREVTQFLAESKGVALPMLQRHLFTLLHQDAVMHLMRVAAGLDSIVLGEGQILAQIKVTHKLAQQGKGVDRILNQLFKAAITGGKRVREETDIGKGAISVSSAAVEMAMRKKNRRSLQDQRCLVVGAGKMGELVLRHLISKGARQIIVLNRSLEKAAQMVEQFGLMLPVATIDELGNHLGAADLIFTCTSASEPLINYERLSQVRREQPLMIFDIAVPRNVAVDVEELSNVHLFNVDHLKQVVEENRAYRQLMVQQCEDILLQQLDEFLDWWRNLEAVPTINSLRQKVETIREQELEKALSRLGTEFGEKHQGIIDSLTRAIVNKILHDPMVQLRAQRDVEARRRALQTLQTLFNLEPLGSNPEPPVL
ncbi:glutamyl-tRNA reductase [Gloeobacter kilaueensis]|uniref:Glutamyl-tRNA reductase n=1 Tax=Gloeobacter kilaueensis (strain ATCC BAA-2537 / CCAP 1431/1 / ULC 316 / JS1) TaxID=1183438 RepID=U5QGP5_GLOK1|nr:glutamyl-tRNA reductase [Gloeobacter kilaueensis]AGY56800.1 glutamyl-tRNA reductase [Gloeobacter kilaueensis JS1]